MTEKPFSVTFVPIFIDSLNDFLKPSENTLFSDETANTVNEIYTVVNGKLLTGANDGRTADRIKNSFFCCCFSEGIAMFALSLGESGMHLSLSGYFIPVSCLKTAWKIFRKELVYICAAGAEHSHEEKYVMGADEIYFAADKAKKLLSPELLDTADSVAEKISGQGVPFSFARTGLPTDILPVYFESEAMGGSKAAVSEEPDIINIDKSRLGNISASVLNKMPLSKELYLCSAPGKKYIALKKEELKAELGRSEFKSESKLLDTRPEYQKDTLWYFRIKDRNGLNKTELLDAPYQSELMLPCFDFYILPGAVNQAGNLVKKAQEDPEEHQESGKPKKLIGLFGRKK